MDGRLLGSYRLGQRIAVGGMGVVYQAEHIHLGRKAAIKVLRPELAEDRVTVERFFNEAKAVNRIGHRNIIDVIDFVEERQEGRPLIYMVMELLSGIDLGAHIRIKGALPVAEALAISLQVVSALIAVHREGILHRDLKPENIFLADPLEGERGVQVKLLDFGIAKALDPRKEERLTDPGSAVGTPEYMAPEQILDRKLDQRTDLYAVGMMLYEMLTGSSPFGGAPFGEVLVRAVQEIPPPIMERRFDSVTKELDGLVMRCLEKAPEKRFQSAEEMHEALARCLAAETSGKPSQVLATLDNIPLLPKEDRAPKRIVLGLLAAGVLALAGGLWWWLSGPSETPAGAPTLVQDGAPLASPDSGPAPDRSLPDQQPAPDSRAAAPDLRKRRHTHGKRRPRTKTRRKPASKTKRGQKKLDVTRRTLDPFSK
jgi:serine/threonine-protein kinase